MRQYAPFFVAFAAVWVLQLYATAKQSQHFMRQVTRLREFGEVAIGASTNSRLRRRVYVALASDETDLVTAAVELSGVTVFARATDVPDLVGRPLRELADAPGEARRDAAAGMAARALLGEQLDPDAPVTSPTAALVRSGVRPDTAAGTRSGGGHLPARSGPPTTGDA